LDEEKIATETEAQIIARRFLLTKYPQSRVSLSSAQLFTKDNSPVYLVRGQIIMRSRGALEHFFFSTSPNQYSFKVEVDAKQRKVVNYEFD